MDVLEVALELPGKLGAEALANSKVNDALRAHGIRVKWDRATSEGVERMSSYHDFGATLVVVAGTAVAGKAVAGIFEVLKVIIQEAHAIHRQREQHEHERIVLCLKLRALKYDFDLDKPLSDLEAELADVEVGEVDVSQAQLLADTLSKRLGGVPTGREIFRSRLRAMIGDARPRW